MAFAAWKPFVSKGCFRGLGFCLSGRISMSTSGQTVVPPSHKHSYLHVNQWSIWIFNCAVAQLFQTLHEFPMVGRRISCTCCPHLELIDFHSFGLLMSARTCCYSLFRPCFWRLSTVFGRLLLRSHVAQINSGFNWAASSSTWKGQESSWISVDHSTGLTPLLAIAICKDCCPPQTRRQKDNWAGGMFPNTLVGKSWVG